MEEVSLEQTKNNELLMKRTNVLNNELNSKKDCVKLRHSYKHANSYIDNTPSNLNYQQQNTNSFAISQNCNQNYYIQNSTDLIKNFDYPIKKFQQQQESFPKNFGSTAATIMTIQKDKCKKHFEFINSPPRQPEKKQILKVYDKIKENLDIQKHKITSIQKISTLKKFKTANSNSNSQSSSDSIKYLNIATKTKHTFSPNIESSNKLLLNSIYSNTKIDKAKFTEILTKPISKKGFEKKQQQNQHKQVFVNTNSGQQSIGINNKDVIDFLSNKEKNQNPKKKSSKLTNNRFGQSYECTGAGTVISNNINNSNKSVLLNLNSKINKDPEPCVGIPVGRHTQAPSSMIERYNKSMSNQHQLFQEQEYGNQKLLQQYIQQKQCQMEPKEYTPMNNENSNKNFCAGSMSCCNCQQQIQNAYYQQNH